jgi:hypothetical protein
MSRFSLRAVLALGVLVVGLSLPVPAAAAVQGRHWGPTRQPVVEEQPSLLRVLWNALSSLWGKDGVKIDPLG